MKSTHNAWIEYLVDEALRRQVARERRATARANVRAGNYTNGDPMTLEDRQLYAALTVTALMVITLMAILIGSLIALAVVGK